MDNFLGTTCPGKIFRKELCWKACFLGESFPSRIYMGVKTPHENVPRESRWGTKTLFCNENKFGCEDEVLKKCATEQSSGRMKQV